MAGPRDRPRLSVAMLRLLRPRSHRTVLLLALAAATFVVQACIIRPSADHAASAAPRPWALPAPQPIHPTSADGPPSVDGRLPALAKPVHYDLDLEVDPGKRSFYGRTVIAVVVERPTAVLVLHAEGLFIRTVEARFGAEQLEGKAVPRSGAGSGAGEVALSFPGELPAGRAEITLKYGKWFATGSQGLFSRQVGDAHYAFSELEPAYARQMFPCFDEPTFKVPFDVAVTVPEGMIALSNTPERSRVRVAGGVRFQFETTPPLPTYLVAIAVGDFTLVAGPPGPVPIRLVVPKGKAPDPGVAILADELTRTLGAFVGSPYPMAKLDLVGIPDLPFAMENPGLLSFSEAALLPADPASGRGWERMRVEVLAHELAHQWFGDLVTLRWWDDAWLNEGLATYVSARAIDTWRPAFRDPYVDLRRVEGLIEQDALSSSQPIHRRITTPEKGATAIWSWADERKAAQVMSMVDRFVGHDIVRDALRRYLRDYAWGSAQTSDLLASFAGALPSEALLTSFLDQAGAPVLEWTERCADGRLAGIDVRQEPLQLGAAGSSAAETRWAIPFCVSVDGAGPVICQELGPGETTVPVVGPRCPAFVDPDPGGRGYYQFRVTPEALGLAVSALGRLGLSAKLGLLSNAWETVRRRQLPVDELLRFLPHLDAETDPAVIREVTTVLGNVDETFVDDRTRRAFDAYVRARLARHKVRMGLFVGAGSRLFADSVEDHAKAEAGWLVALSLARAGDPEVTAAAAERVRLWMNGGAQNTDGLQIALRAASPRLNEDAFSGLLSRLEKPSHEGDRSLALIAIEALWQPAQVERALEASLSSALSSAERGSLLRSLAGIRRNRAAVFEWVAKRWVAISERLRGQDRWPMWQLVAFACDREERDSLERLFRPTHGEPDAWLGGLASWYAQDRERGERCSGLAEYGSASVARFLGAAGGVVSSAAPADLPAAGALGH
jgi:cytosol alanyl aminopeptidase